MTEAWSAGTSWDEISKRAAGRRRYNAVRQFRAADRRAAVARLLFVQGALTEHGTQARLARQLGVSRSTICRDIAALVLMGHHCPICGAYTRPHRVESSWGDDANTGRPR